MHINFQGHLPFGSREDFLMFLPYMGMTAILVMRPGPLEQTFVPPSHGEYTWNLASIGLVVTEEKKFKNIESERFGPSQWMTLIFGTHKVLCTHLVDCIYQHFYIIDCIYNFNS